MTTQTFTHSPLPSGSWFRLLRILPGSFEDPIRRELLTQELDTAEDYEPISYAWGDPTMSHEIMCNDCSLFITKNLFQALRRFRGTQPRFLWADGICINQSDEAEKSSQVSFMSRIYEKGYQTLIWLGEDDEHDGCAETSFAMIKQYNRYIQSHPLATDTNFHQKIWESLGAMSASATSNLISWQELDGLHCLSHLFRRPWFSRIWVINEVGLSKRATAFLGRSCIAWSEIVLCAVVYTFLPRNIHNVTLPTGDTANAFKTIWTMTLRQGSWLQDQHVWLLQEIANDTWFSNYVSFLGVLNLSRNFSATDPRDHIFALLTHPWLQGLLAPNYSWSLAEVHLRVVEQLLYRHQRLDILNYVENEDADVRSSSTLPSWVPQWHRAKQRLGRVLSWNALNVEPDEVVIRVSDNRLHVAALLVDKVDKHSELLTWNDPAEPADTTNAVQQLYSLQQEAHQSVARNSPISNTRNWAILIGTLVDGSYSRPDLKQDFMAYFENYELHDLAAKAPFSKPKNARRFPPDGHRFADRIVEACFQKKFFTTLGGRCGLGPGILADGDILAIVFGCNAPLLLRPADTSGMYKLVGSCYLWELMFDNKENYAAINWRNGSLQKENICLV